MQGRLQRIEILRVVYVRQAHEALRAGRGANPSEKDRAALAAGAVAIDHVQFLKRLRAPIKSGEITTSVRIWKSPRVKVGNRYPLEGGFVVVDKIYEIEFDDISQSMARSSGFAGVADLLKTAKHGSGESVYFVEFHYEQA